MIPTRGLASPSGTLDLIVARVAAKVEGSSVVMAMFYLKSVRHRSSLTEYGSANVTCNSRSCERDL